MAEFQCVVCKLKYKDGVIAKQCLKWCSNNDSCNYHIAKQAVNKDEVAKELVDDERFNSN